MALPERRRDPHQESMLRPYVGPEERQTLAALDGGLHCPRCTAAFSTHGFASAFWTADAIVYFCWCHACGWLGELWDLHAVTSQEAVEGGEEAAGPRLGVVDPSGTVGTPRPRRRP